jgi:hypothetical protein
VPFGAGEKRPSAHWRHLGWNPIQAGDDFGHGARVLEHLNDGRSLYTKCVPMQWPLDNVPADCTFECWLELDAAVVKMRCRLNNARTDTMQHPARLQELPAVYLNAPFHKVVSYTGARPFTDDAPGEIARPAANPDHWTQWMATERWSALVNDEGWGLGLWNPACVRFTGGFAGNPGPGDSRSPATGYLAAQSIEILDHNITHEYRCELILGTVAEIRARVRSGGVPGLPEWRFDHDRQGWHYRNARDTGWPVEGALRVLLDGDDPQLIGPATFFTAEAASKVVIEAAFITRHHTAEIFWKRHDGAESSRSFPIEGDGKMRRHEVWLADSPGWHGGIVQLRVDPVPSGGAGERVEVKAVALEK